MELAELAVFTDDVPATASFYEHLLGTEPVARDDGIAIFDVDGVTLLVHENYDADDGDLPAEDHVSFEVEDVDGTFEKLVESGLTPFREPADHDWGRSAYLEDPDGRIVELAAA